jgi:hypothetical protein
MEILRPEEMERMLAAAGGQATKGDMPARYRITVENEKGRPGLRLLCWQAVLPNKYAKLPHDLRRLCW